jgi:DNA-binding IclR family transcriptional regulator
MPVSRDRYLIKSILSAADLLSAFESQAETLRLKQLVERSGFTKAKAYRLLYTLERCGFIERVGEHSYRSTIRARNQRFAKVGYA